MAFLSGEKHRLYIGEESIWGQPVVDMSTAGSWNRSFVAYTRPGTKPSLH